jgi:hypothetical protein
MRNKARFGWKPLLQKNPSTYMMNKVTWVTTTPSLDCSRWCDSQSTMLEGSRWRLGLILIVWLMPLSSLSHLHSRLSKGRVWGSCWQLLNTLFMAVNSCIFTWKIYNHGRIGAYTHKFYKWQCIFECRHLAHETEQKHTSPVTSSPKPLDPNQWEAAIQSTMDCWCHKSKGETLDKS